MPFPDDVDTLGKPSGSGTGGSDELDDAGVIHGELHTDTSTLVELLEGFLVGPAFANVRDPQFAGGATGDGVTDDTAAIQAAIDYIGGLGGGVVFVPPGAYMTDVLSVTDDNVYLLGTGEASAINAISGASGSALISWGGVTGGGARNLSFDGGQRVGLADGAILSAYRSERILFSACRVTNWYRCTGIQIIESSNCDVSHNDLYGGSEANSAILVGLLATDGSALAANYNRIAHNKIEELQGPFANGIFLSSTVTSTRPYTPDLVIGNDVIGNTIIRAKDIGIEISYGCNKTRVTANHIERCDNYGILTRETTVTLIEGNVISQVDGIDGIAIGVRSALVADTDDGDQSVSVIGNMVDTCPNGNCIFAREVVGLTVASNTVIGAGTDVPASGKAGITVEENVDGCNVIGNLSELNDDYGIIVAGGNGALVLGNTCRDNGLAGISVYEAPDVTVGYNRCFSSVGSTKPQDRGVILQGAAADRATVKDNDLQNNTVEPFNTDGAGANQRVAQNIGYVTEARGTSTITAAATSVTISHGLSGLVDAAGFNITPTNNPTNDPGNIWVDTVTATQFNVNCRNVPGVSTLTFSWNYRRAE